MLLRTPTSRGRTWEWIQTGLLAANLAWTTLCLGGYLAQTMVVTSTLTAALLVVHAAGWYFGERRRTRATLEASGVPAGWRVHPAGVWFIPFLAYAVVNVLAVSPVPWLGWIDWFGWAQMIAVFWVVLNGNRSRETQRALYGVLFALAVIAVLLGCYQQFIRPDWLMLGRKQALQFVGRASGPFGIPNSLAALLILLFPLALALAARRGAGGRARVLWGGLALVLPFGIGLTISRGGWLALGLALTVWPLLSRRVSWWRRTQWAAAAFGAVVAIGALAYVASPLVRTRLTYLMRDAGERSRPILWSVGWKLWQAEPVLGTGAGSFDVLFERHRPEGFLNAPRWAHNDYLNTLTDYGAVGFVLFFGAVGLVVWRSARAPVGKEEETPEAHDPFADPWVRQAEVVGLLAFGLQMVVDFHFKIPALAMTVATVAALAVGRAWPAQRRVEPAAAGACGEEHPAGWRAVPVLFVISGVAIVAFIMPQYWAEALRQRGREWVNRLGEVAVSSPEFKDRLDRARRDLTRAVELAPANGQAWADRSYALAQLARRERDQADTLGRLAEADAERALICSPLVAEFWVRRGVARDLQGQWVEAGDDFVTAVSLSPKAVLPWYHYAYHLALKSSGIELAKALVEFCLRLDPQNTETLRLREYLAARHNQS